MNSTLNKWFQQIKWRPVITGTILQFLLGIFCIRFEYGRQIFQCLGDKAAIFFGFVFVALSTILIVIVGCNYENENFAVPKKNVLKFKIFDVWSEEIGKISNFTMN